MLIELLHHGGKIRIEFFKVHFTLPIFFSWVLYLAVQLDWSLSAELIALIVTAEGAGEEKFLCSPERSPRRRVKCQHLVKIYSCLDWGLEFVRFSRKNAISFDKRVHVDVLGNLFRRCEMLHTLPILLQKAEIDVPVKNHHLPPSKRKLTLAFSAVSFSSTAGPPLL